MNAVTENLDLYWSGFLTSLRICVVAMVGSLLLGTIIAAASHEISTSQLRNMLRMNVVISVQKSTDVRPIRGAR